VHPTGGSLRVFKRFSWLEAGSVKVALSHPTHQRVTRAVRQSLIMLTQLKFELGRFFRGHWLHFLLAIPGAVLWTILHEAAHALTIMLQGGQVTKFVWIPSPGRLGYVEYNFPDHPFSSFAIAIAPYAFWLLFMLLAGALSLRARPYPHWVASTIFIWMFVVPLGDIAWAAGPYLFEAGNVNDLTDAFGPPTRMVSMLIVLFCIASVVFGMIVQQRLYRERALSASSYTLLALVGLALLRTVSYCVKLFWS
jgi:hypothetical protein